MNQLATITIDIDPTIHVGPISIAWHGLMIAVGIGVGGFFAFRYARELNLDRDRLFECLMVVALAGIIGARIFYLMLHQPDALVRPADWVGTRGFAFYGALILVPVAVLAYIRRAHLSVRYLDALAAGFPAGMAVGRIGDLISGEHYGGPTSLPWGIRYLNSNAEVPSSNVPYHSGGLYEIVLAVLIFAIVWPLRHRLRAPGMLLFAVIGLYSAGRFVMFFFRKDTGGAFLGMNTAQITSLALLGLAIVGLQWSRGREVT